MTSEDEFRVGGVVTDKKGAAVPALVVKVPDKTVQEYVALLKNSPNRLTF